MKSFLLLLLIFHFAVGNTAANDEWNALLDQLNSPVLRERNEAQSFLLDHYDRFRTQWPDLTEAERLKTHSAEAIHRLRLVQNDHLEQVIQSAQNSFCFKVLKSALKNIPKRNSKGETESVLATTFRLRWSPKVKLVRLALNGAKIELRDNSDCLWLPFSKRASPELEVVWTENQTDASVILRPADNIATDSIATDSKSFRDGQLGLSALLALEEVPFEFSVSLSDNKEANVQTYRQGNAMVQLTKIHSDAAWLDVLLRLQYDNPGDAFESHRNWVYKLPLKLIVTNKDGQETIIEPESIRQNSRSEKDVHLTVRFHLPVDTAGNVKLVWTVPVWLIQRDFIVRFQKNK